MGNGEKMVLDEKWRKSTRSSHDGSCVEVRAEGGDVQVRDTKDRSGSVLSFTANEWDAFVEGVKDGEFNR